MINLITSIVLATGISLVIAWVGIAIGMTIRKQNRNK